MGEYRLAPRSGLRVAVLASFGVAAGLFVLAWISISPQDVGELVAPEADTAAPKHDRLQVSPFGSVRMAAFDSPQPSAGSATYPMALQYASLEGDPEVATLIPQSEPALDPPLSFPTVERSGKGDMLVSRPRPRSEQQGEPRAEPLPAEFEAAMRGQASTDEAGAAPEQPPSAEGRNHDHPDLSILDAAADPDPTHHFGQIYFDAEPADPPFAGLEPLAQGEELAQTTPHQPVDGDLKRFALAFPDMDIDQRPGEAGVSVAGKGEVTGEGRRPKSPSERLGLDATARAKAETCLADAVYFEARGEPARGQIAVAQVVMNRVFSGYYPDDVCGVVYQNAGSHSRCQFTFACNGGSKAVREPDAYDRAKRIAKETLDGRLWLAAIGKATHYHAYWVHPRWVREMHKLRRIGVHTFYRPRGWGSGAEAPSWGSARETAAIAASL